MKVAAGLHSAVDAVIDQQKASKQPLAIVLAGHNGSGKSTMWYDHLADRLKVPLINADRMMLSILTDNSLSPKEAFTPVWVQSGADVIFDIRSNGNPPELITNWMKVVCARATD